MRGSCLISASTLWKYFCMSTRFTFPSLFSGICRKENPKESLLHYQSCEQELYHKCWTELCRVSSPSLWGISSTTYNVGFHLCFKFFPQTPTKKSKSTPPKCASEDRRWDEPCWDSSLNGWQELCLQPSSPSKTRCRSGHVLIPYLHWKRGEWRTIYCYVGQQQYYLLGISGYSGFSTPLVILWSHQSNLSFLQEYCV